LGVVNAPLSAQVDLPPPEQCDASQARADFAPRQGSNFMLRQNGEGGTAGAVKRF
jgi:hypothetical protein